MDERWLRPLRELRFVVIDLETTGLKPRQGDRACEVALVEVGGGEIRTVFQTLLNPQIPIPADATTVHGITDEMVARMPTLEQVLPEILRHLEGAVLAAYNAPFELGFIRAAVERAGLRLRVPCLDVLEVSKWLVPSMGYKLERVARALGISVKRKELHRAEGDALLTAKVLLELLDRLERRGFRNLGDVRRRLGERAAFQVEVGAAPPGAGGLFGLEEGA